MKYLILLGIMQFFSSLVYCQQITTKSLLKEMTSFKSVASWPVPFYSEHEASSYDRRSVSATKAGWFSNHDFSQYILAENKDGHTEYVMLDSDGPGAIVRFWLTSTEKRDGILRIYFDNQKEAAIVIPQYDLMKSKLPLVIPHSSYEANGRGGSTLYFPLPYSKHCKITWEEHDSIGKPPRYYQINYRTYAKGTDVQTFNFRKLSQLNEMIDTVRQKLWHAKADMADVKVGNRKHVGPGDSVFFDMPKGPMAIKRIKLILTTAEQADYAQALRSTVIKASFDGKETIWCPVGDFFGGGVGGKPLQSWYRTVTDKGEAISRWVMPYKDDAVISVVNYGTVPVTIDISVLAEKWKWTNNTLYFHTTWRRQRNVKITKWDSTGAVEWTQIEINGKGLYVGNTLSIFNKMHTWYGEGDQKIWIDGDTFPSEFGTGAEDYYNTSWAPVKLYQTPFANAPRADNTDAYGYNTFTRTRNLDAIPFKRSFRFTLEMLGWENGHADFAATTYWYGTKGSSDRVKDMKQEASLPLLE